MPLPGGTILSGVGGRIFIGEMGIQPNGNIEADDYFDVGNWTLVEDYLNAPCTHSGTYGAITRRRVGYDFMFSAVVPFDQDNPPESLLKQDDGVAIRLNLGNPDEDPSVIASGNFEITFYKFAPICMLQRVHTILDAMGRDVIRQEVMGVGNSRMFLMPDQNAELNAYLGKLRARNWIT